MPKIFISHAFEDKAALADELAHELKAKYDVWYDKFELTAGDSLLGKINEGLASCDYGVVILSPSFFLKKWTRSELDGLMAIETANRKVILPIWLNVSQEAVRDASPILAGRLGIDGSLPISSIVSEIQRAIEVAARVSSFPKESDAMNRLRNIAQKQEGLKNAERLRYSEQGVLMMQEEIAYCRNALQQEITGLASSFPNSKFHSDFNRHGSLEISGPHNVLLVFQFSSQYTNSLQDAYVRYIIGIRSWGERELKDFLHEVYLFPSFDHESRLIWTEKHEGTSFTTEQLREHMLKTFIEEIETAEEDARLRR